MKYYCMALLFLSITAMGNTSGEENSAIRGLVNRIMPDKAEEIEFEKRESEDGKDEFKIESRDGKVVISGNSPLSQAVGLNWYLKYHCMTSVSWWNADPVELPEELPKVENPVRRECEVENRFFLNYCTFGYTMPWWTWEEWEHFIDWMALNGVNMPLAIVGQEGIWQRVWKEFGLSDEQIRSYFTGPAHLPWHRMANIDKWNGPLPQSYIDSRIKLQKKILERERAFSMTPVLPAFAGHVPGALKETQSEANISRLNNWGGFSDPYVPHFLDPEDPLFAKIQKRFLEEQTKAYGTDHIYGTDPFNEMNPPSWEPDYLAKVADTIYKSMTEVDPDAVWLQMGWLFYYQRKDWTPERVEAMLNAVPQGKMMLLDYYCEYTEVWKRTDAFYGQPYIWSYLGNFGGNTYLAGNLKTVEKRMTEAFASEESGQLTGVGCTLEALDTNPHMYEFVLEKPWRNGSVNVTEWIRDYARSRIGQPDENAEDAWETMLTSVYTSPARTINGTIINARPQLDGYGMRWTNPKINYDNEELLHAWEKLLLAEKTDRSVYLHDLVNVGSQVISNYASELRDQMIADFRDKDLDAFNKSSGLFLSAIRDVDQLLATRDERLLGSWIESARAFGVDPEERDYFENNARTLLTTWGEQDTKLNDYANRNWAGLIQSYYLERWKMFVTDLKNALESNESFDESRFHNKVVEFEQAWTEDNTTFISKPQGDAYLISRSLLQRYAPLIKDK